MYILVVCGIIYSYLLGDRHTLSAGTINMDVFMRTPLPVSSKP